MVIKLWRLLWSLSQSSKALHLLILMIATATHPVQNLIVDGSPRWEVYRTVPVEAAQAAAGAADAPGASAPSAVQSVRPSLLLHPQSHAIAL